MMSPCLAAISPWIWRFGESAVTAKKCRRGGDGIEGLARRERSARGGARQVLLPRGGSALLAEADQVEVPERRHRAALDQADSAGACRPFRIALERKLGAPAELERRR